MKANVLSVPRMNWNDCYNSLAMAIYGVSRYAGDRYSLEDVLFYTGQGFLVDADDTLGPMNGFGDGELLRGGLALLGFDAEWLGGNMHGEPWREETTADALSRVRDSIDRGLPAIGWNLDNYEHGLIYGYDDERQTLSIHDINARQGGELAYGQFGRGPCNGRPIGPELFVMTLKPRGPQPHLNVTRYTNEQDLSYRTAQRNALQTGIRLMEGSVRPAPDKRTGTPAIDVWINAVASGRAHPFFITYNLLWITSSWKRLVDFFVKSGLTHCMSLQDHALQLTMLDASKLFLDSFRAWLLLRQRLPFPKGGDLADPALRDAALSLLHEAKAAELQALDALRKVLDVLEAKAVQ
ncbi:hypothetical protein O9H85_11735 [Paenibacillus filicis]|uniref:Uncharacterized protein n=1 Tax=Paenibacillus gyeongsangnamensis TaxID=3388067 RepID=A0ABT4Q8G5_9BACL|nr:hypothetical protein [Paenibacillus filicis]MCZ8513081.1 hypothetical protein [Paenibacillus filicis]